MSMSTGDEKKYAAMVQCLSLRGSRRRSRTAGGIGVGGPETVRLIQHTSVGRVGQDVVRSLDFMCYCSTLYE